MKKIIAIVIIAMLVGACDDFGDINKNPNRAEAPLTSGLLTNVLSALGGYTTGGANIISGFYAQYFSQTLYTATTLYAAQDWDWGPEYFGTAMDIQKIIDLNTDPATAPTAALLGSNNNQIATARILKALRFSILTDRYGDIPYFGALRGELKAPVDSQEDIYKDLFKELAEAVDQFDDGAVFQGDIMYGGNTLKWKRFANTLRMVLALRISEVDPTLGETEFNAALSADGGVFQSNTDNAKIDYPGGAFSNPWYALGGDQAVSDVIANRLNATGDLRKNAFGKPSGGTLVGFPYGLEREEAIDWAAANPNWSLILNDQNRAQISSLFVLTYADALLAQAQAEYYGWTTGGNYVTLYEDALKASWEQWNVYNAAAFSAFIADASIALAGGGAAADEAKIAEQRWLTFYPNGPQGWAEWRRTGYPVLTPTPNAVNSSKQIPVRFPFPSVEYNYNNGSIMEAVERMGGDNDQTHVWWDVD